MLQINKLNAQVEDKQILHDLSLNIKAGEVHAIMGPNGSGKSTLGNVLTGRDGYEVLSGDIEFNGKNLLDMGIEERAREGMFLAFQYPVEIPGVSNMEFLKAAVDARRKHQGLEELSSFDFMKLARETSKQVSLDPSFLKRGVNEGFSGGEKKRNEIMQMMLLEPSLCILDETDSGLDIDALQVVATGVNAMRSSDRGFIVVTHYQRLLDYIVPDFVHVLAGGKIVKSGDKELARELEAKGYGWLESEVA
ncbi:Fe-S cluster assembly ATPase SufC [Pseudohongiella acticola]|jgi:Fe-S cluster assembly ATP-binding protein|uniref:Fe-S cluster assembly ATPase SufC n=1 Tax=Pseudohongiella acticola TaxID=1524254 RepID=A0A1E8CIG6_9GAMM|nr:Fe-S cluster assembly ATPase SufC [Pseudohongiella acticola]OFE12169.1 Fe-S cluster assembly ATPase SufC [Pseudohongiella acticola]